MNTQLTYKSIKEINIDELSNDELKNHCNRLLVLVDKLISKEQTEFKGDHRHV